MGLTASSTTQQVPTVPGAPPPKAPQQRWSTPTPAPAPPIPGSPFSGTPRPPGIDDSLTPYRGPTIPNGPYGDTQSSTGGQQQSGTPAWATDPAFYEVLNRGWKRGHGGQDIPQERYEYLQRRYNEEAADPNGSHVGDMAWWENRAATDGMDTGEGSSGAGSAQASSLAALLGTGQFTMDPFTGSLNLGSFSYAPFVSPDPWQEPEAFQAPTEADLQADPGYQFQQDEGAKAIQRSAAANGTLLTGGTLQDITKFSQNLASTEFDKLYNRSFNEWKTNYDDSLQKYLLDYNKAFGEHQEGFNEALQSYNASTNAATTTYNAQLSAYNAEAARRQQQFANLLSLAQLAASV